MYIEALRTAIRLTEYDDFLSPTQVYSILALAAIATNNYNICSKAFIKLESLGSNEDKTRAQIEVRFFINFVKYVFLCSNEK